METSLEIVKTVKSHYPNLKIYARARNRLHAFELLDLNVIAIRRETFDSSLRMASDILIDLGFDTNKVQKMTERFRDHDESMLLSQHKVRHDEQKLLSVSKIGAEQLAQVLQEDQTQSYINLQK